MPILLFDSTLIEARLTAQVSDLRKISGAVDFAAAEPELRQVPAAFVIETANRPGPSRTGTQVVSQSNEIRFGVIIAAQNLRDVRGAAAKAALKTLREAVMTALLGWPPNNDYDPCTYGSGRLLQMNNQVLWWQDDYLTSALIRSA